MHLNQTSKSIEADNSVSARPVLTPREQYPQKLLTFRQATNEDHDTEDGYQNHNDVDSNASSKRVPNHEPSQVVKIHHLPFCMFLVTQTTQSPG